MAALVNANAAKLQQQRISSPAWRDTNHALVRGGVLQLQSVPHSGDRGPAAPKLPAWQQPLSTLLSAPAAPEAVSQQMSKSLSQQTSNPSSQQTSTVLSSAPSKSTGKASPQRLRSTEGWNLEGEPMSPLRDRVANTRRLSSNLKTECLERLERIDKIIPKNLRQRPSWIHDADVDMVGSLGADGDQASDIDVDSQDVFGSVHRESQLDEFRQERIAELFGVNAESHSKTIASAYGTSSMPSLVQSRFVASRGSAAGNGGGQRRRRAPWTMDNRNLTAAASVWKTTAPDGPPGSASPRGLLLSRGRPMSVGGQKLSASQSAPLVSSTGTLVMSASPLTVNMKDVQIPTEVMKGALRPGETARGLNSTLRTTLRYALQV